jgi:hypothetical protein
MTESGAVTDPAGFERARRPCASGERAISWTHPTKADRASRVIWTDDTTVPVWAPTLPAARTGRFWVDLGDARNPFRVYDFTPRRSRDGPERFLGAYRGYLQADSFAGYDRIWAGPGVIRAACCAHVRRKFYECRATAPVPAHEALARIRQLYRIEDTCREMSAGRAPCPAATGHGADPGGVRSVAG